MKRSTALHHLIEIAKRIKIYDGVIPTPEAFHPFIKVHRAWVFGSFVRSKEFPNDLDILIDYHTPGEYDETKLIGLGCWEFWKAYPITHLINYLRSGMKKVSIHEYDVDGDLAYPRVLIYPRFDWNETVSIQPRAAWEENEKSGKHFKICGENKTRLLGNDGRGDLSRSTR